MTTPKSPEPQEDNLLLNDKDTKSRGLLQAHIDTLEAVKASYPYTIYATLSTLLRVMLLHGEQLSVGSILATIAAAARDAHALMRDEEHGEGCKDHAA